MKKFYFLIVLSMLVNACGGASSNSSSQNHLVFAPQNQDTFPQTNSNGGTNAPITLPSQPAPEAFVSNRGSNTISVLDSESHGVIDTISLTGMVNPGSLALSPDKSRLYVAMEGAANGTLAGVVVIDTATHNILAMVPDTTGLPHDIVVHPSQNKAYICSFNNGGNGKIKILDTTTNSFVSSISVDFCHRMAIRNDGAFLYVARTNFAGNVKVYNTATNTLATTFVVSIPNSVGGDISDVAISPDGSKGYIASFAINTGTSQNPVIVANNQIVTFDPQTNTLGAIFNVGFHPLAIAFSPNSQIAYVTNQSNGSVSIVNTLNQQSVTVGTGLGSTGIAVAPDGAQTFIANQGSVAVTVFNNANLSSSSINVGNQPTDVIL